MPWEVFFRRPASEGLASPPARGAAVGIHHDGVRPRRPLVRVRWGHAIPAWAIPPRNGARPKN
jgi:hypothetical protein